MIRLLLIALVFANLGVCYSQVKIISLSTLEPDGVILNPVNVHLEYNQNSLIFDFEDKKDANANFYFQLINLDFENKKNKWTNIGSANKIIFSKLVGGKYLFRVKSKDSIDSTIFVIEHLFWQQWWFIPMLFLYAIISITIIIYLVFKYHYYQKIKELKIREMIASDLHDDIGSTLSSIAFGATVLSNKLKNLIASDAEILQSIKDDSIESINKIRETVWSINPVNDSNYDLFEKLRNSSLILLNTKNIDFEYLNNVSHLESISLTMLQRKNCYLIIKEAINNICKHSGATNVSLKVDKIDDGIIIILEDNGVGFDTLSKSEGNGLNNFSKRAIEANFVYTINSVRDIGTKITLSIIEYS